MPRGRGRAPGISVSSAKMLTGNGSDISPPAKEIEMGRVSGDNWRDSNGQKRAGVARGRNRGGRNTRKRVRSFSRNRHLDGMPVLAREKLFSLSGQTFVSSVSLSLSFYLVSLLVCMRTHYPRLSLSPGHYSRILDNVYRSVGFNKEMMLCVVLMEPWIVSTS